MNFDEFKSEILLEIRNRDEIPEQAIMIITKAFTNMKELYDLYKCMNPNIQEYMIECMEQAKLNIKTNIGNDRETNHLKQVEYILNEIERESIEIKNKEDTEKEKYKYFEEIDGENNKTVTFFNMILKEQMENVNVRQRRLLSSRGYSDERILSIQNEARTYIDRYIQNNEKELYDLFEKDDNKLQEWLISKYDEYIKSNKKEDKREEFKKEIDAGISLEEQHENAINFQEDQQNGEKEKPLDLPDNVIE